MSAPFVVQPAKGVPFDKDNHPDCNFKSEDVQSAIEELCDRIDNLPLITHRRNAAGSTLMTYNLHSNSHIDSDPLIVCDKNGDVIVRRP